MLGDAIVERSASSTTTRAIGDSLVFLGTRGNGVPVWINRRWLEADVRITTGFVEPHFFAGFSGGPKMVTPGLAGLETTLVLHDATADRPPEGDLGDHRGQPRARRRPGRRRRRATALFARRDPQPGAADHRGLRAAR